MSSIIRPERTARTRNGLPERGNYTYRGSGEDTRTANLGAQELAALKPAYEQWLPEMPRGNRARRNRGAR